MIVVAPGIVALTLRSWDKISNYWRVHNSDRILNPDSTLSPRFNGTCSVVTPVLYVLGPRLAPHTGQNFDSTGTLDLHEGQIAKTDGC